MPGKGDGSSTTGGLHYPMVDLFTGGTVLPLMFINAAATYYLLSLTAPLAFMEAWSKALEDPTIGCTSLSTSPAATTSGRPKQSTGP